MTPEQHLAHAKKDANLKRNVVLLRHYADEVITAMALTEAALMAANQASPLVMANAQGQQMGGDQRSAAAQVGQENTQRVMESLHNLKVVSAMFLGSFEKPGAGRC